jgi:hypothetical protein
MPTYWTQTGTYRYRWLSSRVPAYFEAAERSETAEYLQLVFTDYFATFHWSTDSDDEPNGETTFEEPTDTDGIQKKEEAIAKKKEVISISRPYLHTLFTFKTHKNNSSLEPGFAGAFGV